MKEYCNESPSLIRARDRMIGGNHYGAASIQPIDFILANNLGWCEGNAVKYIFRHRLKNGKEDLLKAKHYIDLLIEREYDTTPATASGERDQGELLLGHENEPGVSFQDCGFSYSRPRPSLRDVYEGD